MGKEGWRRKGLLALVKSPMLITYSSRYLGRNLWIKSKSEITRRFTSFCLKTLIVWALQVCHPCTPSSSIRGLTDRVKTLQKSHILKQCTAEVRAQGLHGTCALRSLLQGQLQGLRLVTPHFYFAFRKGPRSFCTSAPAVPQPHGRFPGVSAPRSYPPPPVVETGSLGAVKACQGVSRRPASLGGTTPPPASGGRPPPPVSFGRRALGRWAWPYSGPTEVEDRAPCRPGRGRCPPAL